MKFFQTALYLYHITAHRFLSKTGFLRFIMFFLIFFTENGRYRLESPDEFSIIQQNIVNCD